MAGSWGDVEKVGVAAYCGPSQNMFAVKRGFTADSSDATVPKWVIDDISPSFLSDIGVVFDSVTPPNEVTITVNDIDGLQVCQGTFTQSERGTFEGRPSVVGGCEVVITGNTINGAKAKIILNFANNLR